MKRLLALAAGALVLFACDGRLAVPEVSLTPSTTVPAGVDTGVVKSITDGDTFRLEDGRAVRFIGIDTPELHDNQHGKAGCFANAAKDSLASLIPVGSTVHLVPDHTRIDRYGRTLAYVELPGGSDVGLLQVQFGAAVAKRYPPDTARALDYEAAEKIARTAGAGQHNPAAQVRNDKGECDVK